MGSIYLLRVVDAEHQIAATRPVFEDNFLLQNRVERAEARRIYALGAVIVLAVGGRSKIERRKVRPAKSQRNRGPDHYQPESSGYSDRQAPQDCFASPVHNVCASLSR